jgi:hypothetical protein
MRYRALTGAEMQITCIALSLPSLALDAQIPVSMTNFLGLAEVAF